MSEIDKQILENDIIHVHKIIGITFINHLLGSASHVLNEDIPVVLSRLSVLEATGKLRCIRSSSLDTVLERT